MIPDNDADLTDAPEEKIEAGLLTGVYARRSTGHFLTESTHLRLPHLLAQEAVADLLPVPAPPNDTHRS
jgi:hypothetical protein